MKKIIYKIELPIYENITIEMNKDMDIEILKY